MTNFPFRESHPPLRKQIEVEHVHMRFHSRELLGKVHAGMEFGSVSAFQKTVWARVWKTRCRHPVGLVRFLFCIPLENRINLFFRYLFLICLFMFILIYICISVFIYSFLIAVISSCLDLGWQSKDENWVALLLGRSKMRTTEVPLCGPKHEKAITPGLANVDPEMYNQKRPPLSGPSKFRVFRFSMHWWYGRAKVSSPYLSVFIPRI